MAKQMKATERKATGTKKKATKRELIDCGAGRPRGAANGLSCTNEPLTPDKKSPTTAYT
jgi:hypothetical protein